MALMTQDSSLWKGKKTHFCYFKPPCLRYFVLAALGHSTHPAVGINPFNRAQKGLGRAQSRGLTRWLKLQVKSTSKDKSDIAKCALLNKKGQHKMCKSTQITAM